MSGQRPVDAHCLFCKIIAGDIPCAKVYEDDDILAFLDINPTAKGHTLVVPKGHYPTLLDLPPTEGPALLRAMALVGKALMTQCGAGGFNCFQNNFGPAGQMVFHSHWHIIPRFDNDGLPDWGGKPYDSNDEMLELARALSGGIPRP
jgi:histidine triad (HIT) family protein